MRIDISLLPALAAAFMLVFARIGAMVMLLPGLGESNIPVRIKLGIALLLTLVILPLHRAAYHIDMQSINPLLVLIVHEIVIGIVLGATARVTLSALQVAGSVIAQQLGLGFVTAVDPTQGQQGVLVGNFLTMLGITLLFATDSHHLVIAALNDSYAIFAPGELMSSGDVAALATRAFAAAFKIGMQLSAPFLVFGLVFNIGLGVLARLMPQMQVYFVGVPLSILSGFLIFAVVLVYLLLVAYQDRHGCSWSDHRMAAMDLQYHDLRPDRSLFARLDTEAGSCSQAPATARTRCSKKSSRFGRPVSASWYARWRI